MRTTSDVGRRGGEFAAGVRVQPIAGIPVWITAERRQRIGRYGGGRNAFALFLEGGVYDRPMPWQFSLDAYLAGRRGRLPSAATASSTAALTLTRPVYKQFSAGFGVWGGAQPGSTASMPVRGSACGCATMSTCISTGASASPAMPRPARVRRSPSPEISERRARLAAPVRLRLVLWPRMDIYLPIAGQSVNALFIVVLGFLVGVLSGMFGVGGGFLTTPLLIFYGIPPTVAVASAATQITGASVSGAMVHMRRGGVDLKMAGVMIAGGLAGSVVGAACSGCSSRAARSMS